MHQHHFFGGVTLHQPVSRVQLFALDQDLLGSGGVLQFLHAVTFFSKRSFTTASCLSERISDRILSIFAFKSIMYFPFLDLLRYVFVTTSAKKIQMGFTQGDGQHLASLHNFSE